MSIDFRGEPQYEALFQALLVKTKEGKLEWQETADERVFVAAVKGKQTFEIKWDRGQAGTGVRLTVRDGQGKALFATPVQTGGTAVDTFEMAKRIATRMDEKIDETLQLLSHL